MTPSTADNIVEQRIQKRERDRLYRLRKKEGNAAIANIKRMYTEEQKVLKRERDRALSVAQKERKCIASIAQ